MKQYKLIKQYPRCPYAIDTVITKHKGSSMYRDYNNVVYPPHAVENFPKFWQNISPELLNTEDGFVLQVNDLVYIVNTHTGEILNNGFSFNVDHAIARYKMPWYKFFKYSKNAQNYSLLNLKVLCVQDILNYFKRKKIDVGLNESSLVQLAKQFKNRSIKQNLERDCYLNQVED